MNFLFLTALKAEAQPVIDQFGLDKDSNTYIYNNQKISLFITGIGKEKTQSRLQSLVAAIEDFSETVVINIGIAGGNPNCTKIGELYLVNRIQDEETDRVYIPDILINLPLMEKPLTTVKKGIAKNGTKYPSLVDMEAGSIFEVMSKFVPPHRLVFLKVVSDHMDTSDWKSIDVTGLIEKHIGFLKLLMDQFGGVSISDRKVLTNDEMDMLHHGAKGLKLTATQIHQLIEWSENYKKISEKELGSLVSFFKRGTGSKRERNRVFDEIRQYLSA